MEPCGEGLHLRELQDKFNGNKRNWRKVTIDETFRVGKETFKIGILLPLLKLALYEAPFVLVKPVESTQGLQHKHSSNNL